MNRRAFDFAMRAAAKISFGAAVMGCGGTVLLEDAADDDETEVGDDGNDDVAEPEDAFDNNDGSDIVVEARPKRIVLEAEPIVCEAPNPETPDDWWTYDADTFACCTAEVASVLPADPETEWSFDGAPDQATRQCCTQILSENYDAIWSGQPLPHPVADDVLAGCCIAAHGNAGCTPWGPPVPPAMEPGEWVPWMQSAGPGFDLEMMA